MKIHVAVVTPVHNRREITLQCLRSLYKADLANIDLEVIVVDDGSTDGTTAAIAQEFSTIEIINGGGDLWFTEGTNVGVRRALELGAKYVLMMNDDQVFDSAFLDALVSTAEKYRRRVVGSLLLQWDAPHRLFQTAPIWKTFGGGWQHWRQQTVWTVPDKPWRVDLIVGNCLLVPSAAIRECGLMDSKHFPNFGDAEYTPRLKRNGWDLIIEPRSRVFCQPNTTPPRVRDKSLKALFFDLFIDLKNNHSLRRRFYGYVVGGPTKLKGVIAFACFLGLALTRKNIERVAVSSVRKEPSLLEVFGDKVVSDQ